MQLFTLYTCLISLLTLRKLLLAAGKLRQYLGLQLTGLAKALRPRQHTVVGGVNYCLAIPSGITLLSDRGERTSEREQTWPEITVFAPGQSDTVPLNVVGSSWDKKINPLNHLFPFLSIEHSQWTESLARAIENRNAAISRNGNDVLTFSCV